MLNLNKLKKNLIIKDYSKISSTSNTVGKTKSFLPSTKEWINSTYTYYKDSSKLLPLTDKVVNSLLNSYFNFYNRKSEKELKLISVNKKKRRLSVNKIFLSKTELKHTNDNVIITVYTFDKQSNLYSNIMEQIKKVTLSTYYKLEHFISNTNLENNYLKKIFKREILYLLYKQILLINNYKYSDIYLNSLKELFEKIFEKRVIFKIVNLKYYYLNSDILSQVLALKVKKRRGNTVKILNKSLAKIKSPFTRKINFISDQAKNKSFKQKILISKSFYDKLSERNWDNINLLLNNYITKIFNTESNEKKSFILSSIKNKVITGVKLEVSGRITSRITASRSQSKSRYIGSLRNIDSSYKRISSPIIRGNMKFNQQFTKLSSKKRIGSFGVKGWVSSI